MMLLKVFLYLTCFLSLTWSSIIFLGPSALKSIISAYSNGQLVASNIVVTPKLDINIGRLDYTLKDSDDRVHSEGFSRSIKIFWSIFSDDSFLRAHIGPTFIDNAFVADKITISTSSYSELDLGKLPLSAEINNLKLKSSVHIENLKLTAFYISEKNSMSEISAVTSETRLIGISSWMVSDAELSIDEISLTRPVHEQEITTEFYTSSVETIDQKITFSNLDGFLRAGEGKINFKLGLETLSAAHLGYDLGRVEAEGDYILTGILENANIRNSGGSFNFGAQVMPSLIINLSGSEGNIYDIEVLGEVESFDVTFGEKFIGNLPTGSFRMDLQFNGDKSIASVKSSIILDNEEVPSIVGDGELTFTLDGRKNIFDCLQTMCAISGLSLDYILGAGKEWLSGTSTCTESPCNLSSMYHYLKTSNTSKIFEMINRSKLFNPLYTASFYAFISAGTKLDNGHAIRIN